MPAKWTSPLPQSPNRWKVTLFPYSATALTDLFPIFTGFVNKGGKTGKNNGIWNSCKFTSLQGCPAPWALLLYGTGDPLNAQSLRNSACHNQHPSQGNQRSPNHFTKNQLQTESQTPLQTISRSVAECRQLKLQSKRNDNLSALSKDNLVKWIRVYEYKFLIYCLHIHKKNILHIRQFGVGFFNSIQEHYSTFIKV